ncbi:hypothetical protein [Parenemella sanctibonifatiensis]|uniref:hypothetical protein n=1 Tax=Parenemella sanctibonifatiensis TaxID=2016505 RepID=UPI001186E1F4|nr:hypothetical protein [Parenemella sanctibonifatiensis]
MSDETPRRARRALPEPSEPNASTLDEGPDEAAVETPRGRRLLGVAADPEPEVADESPAEDTASEAEESEPETVDDDSASESEDLEPEAEDADTSAPTAASTIGSGSAPEFLAPGAIHDRPKQLQTRQQAERRASTVRASDIAVHAAAPESKRGVRTSIAVGIAAATVIVALVAAFVLPMNRGETAASPSVPATDPEPTEVDKLTDVSMLDPVDLSAVGGQTWQVEETTEQITAESSQPRCIRMNDPSAPVPSEAMLRTLTVPGSVTAVLHRAEAYADVATAEQVFDLRKAQLGDCTLQPLYIMGAAEISQLGDEAVAVQVVRQEQTAEYHVVALVRTGSAINVVDIVTAERPADTRELAQAMTGAVDRQCSLTGGLCSLDPEATPTPPPASGATPGWLAGGDLPRVRPGSGRWNALDPTTNIDLTTTQCEAVDFAEDAGPDERELRTYLLADDPRAPTDFGVDQLVLTFPDEQKAQEYAETILTNIEECPERSLTPRVEDPVPFEGQGVDGATYSGNTIKVTQAVGQGQSAQFRVAILTQGNTMVYLLMTPREDFNWTDEQWTAVAKRAGERLTQAT